jgi:hypothetical protein
MTIVVTAWITWTMASILHSQICMTVVEPPAALLPSQSPTIAHVGDPKGARQKLATLSSPYNGPSRVFAKFEHPFPCFAADKRLMMEDLTDQGILFQRPHKTGSTTMVGIVLRLAHNRAKIYLNQTERVLYKRCSHRAMHGRASNMEYGKRDKTRSFLFSIIRDPTKRLISEFFHFEVTAFQKEPTDATFLKKARGAGTYNYYLKELSTRPSPVAKGTSPNLKDFAVSKGFADYPSMMQAVNRKTPGTEQIDREMKWFKAHGPDFNGEKMVAEILEDYNFIAVMERMDESLVVLQMLLGLTTREILYTRARSGGSFSNGWQGRPCFYIMPSFVSEGMKEYFASEEYQNAIKYDMMVFQAVHKSLDRTIESLGDEFSKNLAALKRGLKLAQSHCQGRIRPMCSPGGEPIPPANRTCYIWAEGCDHDCIDDLEL